MLIWLAAVGAWAVMAGRSNWSQGLWTLVPLAIFALLGQGTLMAAYPVCNAF